MKNETDLAPWWLPPLCGLIAFVAGIGVLAAYEARYVLRAAQAAEASGVIPANTCGPELRR